MSTSQRLLAAFWILAGANHFLVPKAYRAIVPDYLPAHRELVILSGVAEIAGGIAVIPSRTRRFARWWLLGVLAAVYPANIHMALHPEQFPKIPAAALWARLPLQGIFGLLTWRGTR